jgi:hypothetical protein
VGTEIAQADRFTYNDTCYRKFYGPISNFLLRNGRVPGKYPKKYKYILGVRFSGVDSEKKRYLVCAIVQEASGLRSQSLPGPVCIQVF